MKAKIFTMVVVGMLMMSLTKTAQATEETCSLSLIVPEVYSLVLDDTSISDSVTEGDFDAGFYSYSSGANVNANHGWLLTVKSALGFNTIGTYTKAIGDFQIQTSGTAYDDSSDFPDAYGPVSAVNTTHEIATHSSAVADEAIALDYKILFDGDDVAGTYAIDLLYTLVSNGA